jgi:toxin ParE1/3/4
VNIGGDYLKLRVGSHLVFFRNRDGGVDIIRVLHQSMDVGRHLKP